MSVRRRLNALGQMRLDVPHLKSIESAVSNDFDELIKNLVIGENKSYVVRGFKINMPGSINASASSLLLLVENSAILHGASNESGTFYTIPSGTSPEPLNSTTNTRISGSFTPSTDNYIGIEFVRSVDNTTSDQVNFWDPTSNIEFSKTVPLAIVLDYKIVITTASFASTPNVLPIAIVHTDDQNNVKSITDRRQLLYRLGTAGDQIPDPYYSFPTNRLETFYTSTSSTSDPFYGGDKEISTMKDFFDALMTEIKSIKGTSFWYSESIGSISRLRQDIANTAFTGKGSVTHGAVDFQGQVLGMTSDVVIKTTNINPSTSITITANGVNNLNTLISNYNTANPNNQVYLASGIGTQVPTANITLTSKAGQINWDENLYINFIGGKLRYAILANPTSNYITLGNNLVAYIKLVRGEKVNPNLKFTNGSNIVTSVGNAIWTTDLRVGDFIKDASKSDSYYYEIASIDVSGYQVTLTTSYQEENTGDAGIDAQYAYGVYEASSNIDPSINNNPRYVKVLNREVTPFGEDYFWLFYRQDDTGSLPKIYARILGGQELQQGESQQISDNTSLNVLQYIGSAGESDIDPDYTNALGVTRSNIHLIDNENLTRGLKRLEQRNDVIPRVRAVDLLLSSLPTGASVTIDGETLNNGDYVLFTKSPIEGLYKVSGVGSSIAFEKMYAFGGSQTPVNGDLVRVQGGTTYLQTIWKKVAAIWKPLEVADATNELTGFPNRTDSVISFNNTTRTFSISPASTSFDIFSKGRVFRFNSAQSITIPDTEGVYFFYFETNGTLAYSNTFDISIITSKIYVSNVYWSVSSQKAIMLGDERHGITMDGATHEYLHNKNGAVITGGGNIGFEAYPTGGVDGDAQISLTNIVLRDEDIRMNINHAASPSNPFEQILSPIAKIPVYYRDGVSSAGKWLKDNATNFPVKQGNNFIQFNNSYPDGMGGFIWYTIDLDDGKYVSMWVFATNSINEPVIAILGQRSHALLSSAQEQDTYASLQLGIMPFQEFKLLYRVIFQTSSTFTNIPKAMVVDVRDLRSSVDTQFAQVAPNDHGLLSGLNDPDHAPTAVTTVGVVKDGGLSNSDTDLQQSLDTLNKLFGQLRLKPDPSDSYKVMVTGADRVLNNGQKLIQSLKNLVLSFDGAHIDFSTGIVYSSDGITELGVNFTPATINTNEFLNYSITIIPNTVNPDNTITAQIIVLPASASGPIKNDAPKAAFAKGIQLGQVTVQEDGGGGILDITESDISQLGTGGGSGSSGTGDANSFTENLKHRLVSSYYEFVTPIVFEIDENNFTDGVDSTGSFDIANGVYTFSSAAQQFQSYQLFDTDFLANSDDSRQVELHVEWYDSDSRDDNAVYQVSLDGNNFETIPMVRQNLSQKFTGSKQLSIPLNLLFQENSYNTAGILNSTTQTIYSGIAVFNIKSAVNQFSISIYKTGLPLGSYIVSICKDNGGIPGDVLYSRTSLCSSLSAGLNTIIFSDFRQVLSGAYHIKIETDSTYKANYAAGKNIYIQTTSSGSGIPVYKYNSITSTWIYTNACLKTEIYGHNYNLKVKVISSAAGKKLKAIGAFYDETVGSITEGIDALQKFTFSGNLNTTTFTVTRFLPNPDHMKIYDVRTGQVYRRPAFDISGYTITFPSGTFYAPGETVELIFDQSQGTGYDYSDQNANLLATNHLGSTDATVDKSVAGRGIYLRKPNGDLVEVCIDNNNNIVIYST